MWPYSKNYFRQELSWMDEPSINIGLFKNRNRMYMDLANNP